ncbi:MAG: DNA-directed RNA polymerase subunit beta, partial [Acidimicrobiia bacterium]|nr:DNA-directed RNA polymerase subunit beta [Acidimicrobiia bacterium]
MPTHKEAPLATRVAERFSFGKIPEVLPLPDLLAVQHESFKWFLDEGLSEIFSEISPIEDFTGSLALELTDHRFDEPNMTIDEAKERDANWARPLHVTARFMNSQTGEIKEQSVFLGDFPMMTEKGVFIINGTERVIVSQLVRSPGVYYDANPDKTSDRVLYSGKVIPGRGAWLEFDTDKRDTIGVRVDRKRRQYVSAFLRALGIAETDEEILELFDGAESIKNTLERDTAADKDEALLDLYRKLRPGEPTTVDSARGLVQTMFRNPKRYDLTRVGRYKVSQKFNEEAPDDYRAEGLQMLRDEDIIDAIRYLVALHAGDDTVTT